MSERLGPPGDGERPSWMGAPGYTPHPELPPHAPMPGAPPYPPAVEHPPPPLTPGHGRTGFLRALGAAAVWGIVLVVLVLAVAGPPPSAFALGRVAGLPLLPTLIAAVAAWLVLRRRARPFWVVLLVALPFFLVVLLLSAAGAAAS